MKKMLLRVLFFLIPFLWWIYASAQPKKEKDCSTTCFTSEIVSAKKHASGCTDYELEVSFSGKCAHALSHFSVAIPCGNISKISNSQNWKQEIGTDPTTGIRGFKIDNISNFGEGSLSSFRVKFTVCPTDDACSSQLTCWQPMVAYKAATCVNYQTLPSVCTELKASLTPTPVSCSGLADGALEVIIEDGQQPISFTWSDGSAEQSRSGLAAGEYAVTVRDANGTEVTLHETISEPDPIEVAGTTTSASCNGTADGSIDITVSGGNGPYTFAWSNGATTEDLTAVGTGSYTLVVTDQNNCSTTTGFNIIAGSSFTVTGKQIQPDCNDTNGSIDILVAGGMEPYSFSWSTGETSEDLNGIGAGLFTVIVTDNAGCSQEKSFFLREKNTLAVNGSSLPTNCSDDGSGSIDITASGGTVPYTFKWSNGETTEDLSGLTSGYYTVTVQDAKGCTATAGFAVSKTTFQVPKNVVSPTCFGDENGSITLLEPVGGTPPLTYEWSNGQSGTSLSDLGPGTYYVTVTDAAGCSRTLSTTITSPSDIKASATVSNVECNADGYFDIDLGVEGGTAPYEFEWSDGETTEDRTGLSKGSYTVVISDANGCSVTKEVLVDGEAPSFSCLITEPGSAPICSSTGNTLTASIADADSYAWSVDNTAHGWSITDGLNGQTIVFTAGEANSSATFTLVITKDGCTKTCSYTVSTCNTDDTGGEEPGAEEPGGEEPGGEEPGGEEPGEQPGDGGDQTCEECFFTEARLVESSGGCRTYEMEVSTNGLCRHDLSHWTLAIPCGTISNYSNSEGWKMEYGKDPTTGLYGLKVDNISSFGKRVESFTVRFTLCESGACDLRYWDPTVAYKAAQCVGVDNIQITVSAPATENVAVYPNPFDEVLYFEWNGEQQNATVEIIDQFGNIVSRYTPAKASDDHTITLDSSTMPKGMYFYRLTIDGQIYNGKISKR